MMKRRVVITGMGTVNPLGNDVPTFWQNLLAGVSGVSTIERFDADRFAARFAGQIKNFDISNLLEEKEARKLDLYTQYALFASHEAMQQAGLSDGLPNPDRAGTVIGSGIGGIVSFENEHGKFLAKGPRRVSPFFIPQMIADIASGHVSMRYNLRGPNFTTVSACASANHAIAVAYNDIVLGNADIMVTGGAEAPISEMALAGFGNMKALSTRNDDPSRASRPFDKNRDGFVMGEGSGVLVLEELTSAQKRGAAILGEIFGVGYSADAYHLTAPPPGGEGAVRSMRMALGDLPPEKVDYINAHGTSTPLNDHFETDAIKTVFDEHAYKLIISSTKSMTGHLLGAAGGIEAIALALALANNHVPPTINYQEPDPNCDLNYTPNVAARHELTYGLSNTFGFGGHNATIGIKAFAE
jgi:3-oxoacyl-[acyl-carrier-protein] synthase II